MRSGDTYCKKFVYNLFGMNAKFVNHSQHKMMNQLSIYNKINESINAEKQNGKLNNYGNHWVNEIEQLNIFGSFENRSEQISLYFLVANKIIEIQWLSYAAYSNTFSQSNEYHWLAHRRPKTISVNTKFDIAYQRINEILYARLSSMLNNTLV